MSEPQTPDEYTAAIAEIDKTPAYAWTPEVADRKLKLMAGQRDAEARQREQTATRIAALNAQTAPKSSATRDTHEMDAAITAGEERIAQIQALLGDRSRYRSPEEQMRLIDEQLSLEKSIMAQQADRGQLAEAIRAASPPPLFYPPDRMWDEPLVQRLHEAAHREGPDASLLVQTALSVISGEKYAPPEADSDQYWAGLWRTFGSEEKLNQALDDVDTLLAKIPAKDRAAIERSGVLRYPSMVAYLSREWQGLHDAKNGERAYQRQLARVSGAPPPRDDRGRFAPPTPGSEGELIILLPPDE